MPKAVKQKSGQKVKTRSPSENTFQNQHHEDGDVNVDGSSEDEEDVPEDEAERKLEKLLFGDDEGFHGALKDHQDRGMIEITGESDREDDAATGDGGEDRDLDDVPDADVSSLEI